MPAGGDDEARGLHPVLEAAARGEMPGWSRCEPGRRRHVERVSRLVGQWAEAKGLPDAARRRWRAAGLLHDALRDAPPPELRGREGVPPEWPDPLLHAPACASRLRSDGVEDSALLRAVAYHPVGHPEFGALGDHLYLADFLDPGRAFAEERRASLRRRMPGGRREVLTAVVAMRIGHLLDERSALLAETVRYWNRCVG